MNSILLSKLANTFKSSYVRYIPEIFMWINFSGKVHLIPSFCFIRNIVAVESASIKFSLTTIYEKKNKISDGNAPFDILYRFLLVQVCLQILYY